MDAVGHVTDRHLVNRPFRKKAVPHLSAHPPVQFAYAVGRAGRLEREHGHAERLAGVVRVDSAQRHQLVGTDTELPGKMSRRGIHQLAAEPVVPGRHRCVRREHALRLHRGQCVVKTGPVGDPLAHQFQREERGVALVHVVHRRLHAKPPQQPHAPGAEQDFLHNPRRVVATVHVPREVAEMRLVRRQVRVEQVDRTAADVCHPDTE